MKYTRRFEKKAEQRQSAVPDRGLAKKVLAAVTAFSVMGQPFAVLASTVTRVPGAAGGDIRFDNGKANIYAEQLVNNNQIAVNRFDQFQISAGDIANMYFKTGKEETITAGTLVNFVNNHIDVSGTVNAIKDNAIGGNLFFLSSSGMAVSNTGVINAGSLTVMTPTQDFMKEILGDELHDFHTDTFSEQWDHISSMEIPINASGTITVEGKVNAPDSIRMKSAHIQVGSRENKGVGQTALLQTGTIDFSNLVNTGNVQAGLEGDLTVKKTAQGISCCLPLQQKEMKKTNRSILPRQTIIWSMPLYSVAAPCPQRGMWISPPWPAAVRSTRNTLRMRAARPLMT